jgi:CYTH domain-containing protein
LAEVELPSDTTQVSLPPWVGPEVSDDPRYFNSNLVRVPFTRWRKS